MIENIVLINDCHLLSTKPVARMDDPRKAGMEKFKFVLDWAFEHRAVISVAGDLCNAPRSWAILGDLMKEITQDDFILAVYGQHDTYMYSEDTRDETTLGILALEKKIRILGDEPFVLDNLRFFGVHFGGEIPDPGPKDEKLNILVIHAPIAEKALWITQDYMDAEKFLKDHSEFDIIHCGDIHQSFYRGITTKEGSRYIVNSGPMIRKEATPYNLKHKPGFYVYNLKGRKISWVEIPHLPADQVLSRDHIDIDQMADEVLKQFIESVKTEHIEATTSIVANIWAIIKENDIGSDVVDVISKTIGERRMRGER